MGGVSCMFNRISVNDYILSKDTNINDFQAFANGILVKICRFADVNKIDRVDLLNTLAGGLTMAVKNYTILWSEIN